MKYILCWVLSICFVMVEPPSGVGNKSLLEAVYPSGIRPLELAKYS